jgi:HEPN domain-containing protein
MSGNEDSIERKVIQWISRAEEDLTLAKHAFSARPVPPWRLIAFHAQQCVEKYIKAFLVFRGIEFPFTHNIARLLELCPEMSDRDDGIEEAPSLSPYAVSTRYEDESEPVTADEAAHSVEIAEKVRNTVRMKFAGRGFPLPE